MKTLDTTLYDKAKAEVIEKFHYFDNVVEVNIADLVYTWGDLKQAQADLAALQRQNARLLELIQVPIDMIGTTWVESYRASDWVKEATAIVDEIKAHE